MVERKRPKIDRAYYSSPEFREKLAEDCAAAANDPEYQKEIAAWMNAPMGPIESDPVIILRTELEQVKTENLELKAKLKKLLEWAINHSNMTNGGACRDCGVRDSGIFGLPPARGRHWGDCETNLFLKSYSSTEEGVE